MDNRKQAVVILVIVGVVGGAFLCGLMCLAAYHG
jgi:hypothetical protein